MLTGKPGGRRRSAWPGLAASLSTGPPMTAQPELTFLIPTWNNLAYLQFCLASLQRNCTVSYQVVLHLNDGADGTLDWVRQTGLDYTHTPTNVGICHGINLARTRARGRYFVYLNDDMYVCPGLDTRLLAEAQRLEADGVAHFMISGTMVEARDSGNTCAIVADYGHSPTEFDEARLLADQARLARPHWNGSSWPPVMLRADTWDIVGGFSIEFSPGMYSDPDLAMKLWQIGCRQFIGVGDALVYHFPSKSTGRVRKNNGRRMFLRKWGITANTFSRYWLRRGTTYAGALPEPVADGRLRARIALDGLKARFA